MDKRMHLNKKLRVGIIRFPGSNCDFDTLNYFKRAGHDAFFIWYRDTKLPKKIDLLVLPGGFAFGDRNYSRATGRYSIDPGRLALKSPVMKIVHAAAKKKIAILGICNGFQILVKGKLLPGKLLQNTSKKFFCDYVDCHVTGRSFFNNKEMVKKSYSIPVAHGYGRYAISPREAKKLQRNGQVFLQYGKLNPNGSVHNIAGVANASGTIFGIMPHPERSPQKAVFMRAIESYVQDC